MGKASKRQPVKHSNHHDNPNRARKAVVRRQHSQDGPKNTESKAKGRSGATKPVSVNLPSNQSIKLKVPFAKWDRVLLVGEGDFSFALSLSQNYDIGSVVATCFDSKEVLLQKYPKAIRTLQYLSKDEAQLKYTNVENSSPINDTGDPAEEWNGFSPVGQESDDEESLPSEQSHQHRDTVLLYGIDATKLSTVHKNKFKPHSPFTKIVFNFPHVGGLSTDVNRQVRSNQQLLVNFFNAAKPLLATASKPAATFPADDDVDWVDYDSDREDKSVEHLKHGQILVTIFEGEPYTLWNIRDLARHTGLKVLESFKFPWSAYPGYQHARTAGDIMTGKDRSEEGKRKGAWRGEERDARCYVLALKDDNDGRPAPGSRKRKRKEDDED